MVSLLGITEMGEIQATKQLNPNNLNVTVKVNYYPIYGKGVQEIRESLRTRGIVSEKEGKRYAAFTHWYVQWNYNYQEEQQQCKITQVVIKTTVTITLPAWQMPSNTPNSLRIKWNQFSQALRQHEENHQRHGVLAGQSILKTLKNLPPSSTCRQLEANANQTAHNIIKKYNQADINYDQQTQHGKTEGAIF
ncbi:DUF922 domain-containing Zn-dependent protease [Gloeothece verrucosa]|uniref:DUF922 domain-containing protein n=1 Tax=Gloeothece verrucosa (strain PCC 7822) TaxID=497965 RepID=E0ULF9_GLOV7|nr:DUF922 domain-containing Zn-dependent protease [Gloeothece verrucosa]ADN17789.1 protein of unknown function DUF922 [Gloeothece verrucosa PCC 7822]